MYKSGHLQGGCPYYASHFENARTDLLHLGAMSAHVFAEQRQECNNMYIINKLCKPKTSARLDKQREQVFHEQRTQSFGKVLSLKGFHHSYSSSGLGNTKRTCTQNKKNKLIERFEPFENIWSQTSINLICILNKVFSSMV